MAKVIKTVAVVVGVAALAVATAGVGAALAGGATLGAAIGAAGATTILGVSASALGAIGAGLSFVGSLAAGQPKVGSSAAGGTQVDWQADPTAAVPYLIGRTGTAGNIVLADTSGDKNRYLTYVTVLSAGPVKSVGGFSADNAAVAFTADGGEGAAGHFQNRMWWKASLGAQPAGRLAWTSTGSKDTPANHGGTPASYGASFKLSGLAHTLWTLSYDTAIYPSGTPKPMQVVEGEFAYDPRQDSTYAGGSGPCRPGVESTYVYTKNPYLHALTWCLGRSENGFPTLGVHAPVSMIDVAAFVDGANVADAHGWELGGVVYSTDAKWDVLRAMLVAGSGKPGKIGAKITCVVNAPRVSLMTITGADVCGEAQIPNTQPRRDRINTIWPRYREEAQGWQIVPTKAPVTVPAYYAADGGRRTKEVEYTLCQSADQAATLARYDIENAREFGPITLPCKPHLLGVRPGDCITVTEPEYGLNGQKCLVLGRKFDPADFTVTLTLQSETDGKHPFALGETADPPPQPGLTGVDIFNVPPPAESDWFALGGVVAGDDGRTVPVIVVHGSCPDPNIARLLIDYRAAGSTVWGSAVALDIKVGEAVTHLINGLPPGGSYVVGLRYLTVRGIDSPRLELGSDASPISTGDLTIDQEQQIVDGVHLAAATGGNALVDTDFQFINDFWCQNYDETYSCGPAVRVLLNGKGALQRATSGTPAAGKEFALGQGYGGHLIAANEQEVRSYALPCKPGDKIEASAYATCANVSRVNAEVYFWDKNGSSIAPQEIAPFVTDFSALSNSDGGIAAMVRPGGFTTAPAHAAYATLDVIAFTNGAGPASLTIQAPMLRIAQAGATELAAATPGVGVPDADKTGTHTAANVTGQGSGATATGFSFVGPVGPTVVGIQDVPLVLRPSFGGVSADGTSISASASIYTGGATVQSLQPATTNADKTANATSAHVAGQGPLATAALTAAQIAGTFPNLVYDGGLTLRGENTYTVPAQGAANCPVWFSNSDGNAFFFPQNDPNGYSFLVFGSFPVFGGASYTAQAEMFSGGLSGGAFKLDIEWYRPSNGGWNGVSPAVQTPYGLGWTPYSVIGVAPSDATAGRVRVYLDHATTNNTSVRRVKCALGTQFTNFSDEATNGSLYTGGTSINALKPQELGANVTENRTSSHVSGQGALATQNTVDLGSQVTNNLASGRIYDSPSNTLLSNRYPAEAGANVTANNVALSFQGKGALATLDAIPKGYMLPTSVNTGQGAVFSTRYPLSSPGPGQVQVGFTQVKFAGDTSWRYALFGTTLNVGQGSKVYVFWNISAQHYDYIENQYPTDQLANPNGIYIYLGSQIAQAADGSYPDSSARPAGGGGGVGS